MSNTSIIKESLQQIFDEWEENVKNSLCATCGSDKVKFEDFKDALSLKEYSISQMCQACQDDVFDGVVE